MWKRVLLSSTAALCTVVWATPAHAQLGSSCLRPLGVPDKWIERQTPPWDPTDTFDPTGPDPDLYDESYAGFNPLEDQGLPMSLVLYDRVSPLKGQSAWPIAVGDSGNFFDEIVACSGWLRFIGDTFQLPNGAMTAPFGPAFAEVIAQDPDAAWDPSANGGRGGVINSAYTMSPRVLALPVFAPNTYQPGATTSPPMAKIVGFFVSHRERTVEGYTIHGYLTGWSTVTAPDVTGRVGEFAPLSATVTGPGWPVVGLPVEFLYEDRVIATAETDGTGTARPSTTSFQIPAPPGEYPGALRVRIRELASFFVADEATANLTVRKKLPQITWMPPADITYGTPLGPAQLNATADVAGVFTYSPGPGTVLPASEWPLTLAVTFVPAEEESYFFDPTEATTFIAVLPAPLTVRVADVTKAYLDPLPAFTTTASGFVNGEDMSVLDMGPGYVTAATASSPVGTYQVWREWVAAENYAITMQPGVLTIVPRTTVTSVQSSGTGPTTYGEAVSFTIAVSSGLGTPAGSVTLRSAGVPVATAPLVNGQATVSVGLSAGTHTLTAEYSGSTGFAASTSTSVVHTVNPASTATDLVSPLNPSRAGQAVTFTATVTTIAPGAGLASGSVEFLRNGVVTATVPLAGGTAEWTIDTLPVGKYTIQARFVGSTNHLASASAVLQQTVKGGGK